MSKNDFNLKTDDNNKPDTRPAAAKRFNSDTLRRILSVFFLVVFLVCGAMLFFDWYDGYLIDKQNETIKDLLGASSVPASSQSEEKTVLPQYAAIYQENSDLVGWIKINNTADPDKADDTGIDFPVVQTENNDDYLRTDFYGNSNRNGTIFVDWHCPIDPMGHVTVIYGHNMKRSKVMFTELRNYTELEYYRSHPIIQFDTIYEEHTYKIFGAVLMDASPEAGAENEFKLYAGFGSGDAYVQYLQSIRDHSYLDIPEVDVNTDDTVIALVTCSYEFDDARYVIFARQVRDGESSEVNVASASENADMVYPAAAKNK